MRAVWPCLHLSTGEQPAPRRPRLRSPVPRPVFYGWSIRSAASSFHRARRRPDLRTGLGTWHAEAELREIWVMFLASHGFRASHAPTLGNRVELLPGSVE